MDSGIMDVGGMKAAHRRLVEEGFREAFGVERELCGMADAELAALVRLQGRIVSGFGLYVLANPATEKEVAELRGRLGHTAGEAVARMSRCRDMCGRAAWADALIETRGYFGDPSARELMRFVEDAAAAGSLDAKVESAAVRAYDAIQPWLLRSGIPASRQAAMRRRVAMIIDGWISVMGADGSWEGLGDAEAIGRAVALADTAIPGVSASAEMIDRCYLRYVMKADGGATATLRRMAARCVHYTDIETEYAAADIAFIEALMGNASLAPDERKEAYATLYDIVLRLHWIEAEPLGIMPRAMRRLYAMVLGAHAFRTMTDDALLAIAAAAADVAEALDGEEYDAVELDELCISCRLAEICRELAVRAVRPDASAELRIRCLELMDRIGYLPAGSGHNPDAPGTACPRA